MQLRKNLKKDMQSLCSHSNMKDIRITPCYQYIYIYRNKKEKQKQNSLVEWYIIKMIKRNRQEFQFVHGGETTND